MKHAFLATLAAASLALSPALALAQAESGAGQVGQMIVKIMTPDGPRWFVLGEEVSPVDITEGKIIEFDYLDDTGNGEAVEVAPEGSSETSGAE